MNFKTTLILAILVLLVGGIALYVSHQPSTPTEPTRLSSPRRLFDLDLTTITRFQIDPAGAPSIVLEKLPASAGQGAGQGPWRITSPISAAADQTQVIELLARVLALRSKAQIGAAGKDAASFGLDHPQCVVKISTPQSQFELSFGQDRAAGSGTYAHLAGQAAADVISDSSIVGELTHALAKLRDKHLSNLASQKEIQQITISRPGGEGKIELQFINNDWEMISPQPLEADHGECSVMASTLVDLQAVDFIDHPIIDPVGLQPLLTVSYSTTPVSPPPIGPTTAAATAPSTQPAKWVTLEFGPAAAPATPDNPTVYLRLGGSQLLTVSADAFKSLDKSVLDLRNRELIQVDPALVTKISITKNFPATTQPTTRPARELRTFLTRVPAPVSTQPTAPRWQWMRAGGGGPDGLADETQINNLLAALHPLRAYKFLPQPPVDKMVAAYTIDITLEYPVKLPGSPPPPIHLEIRNPGGERPLIGLYNRLTFEFSRDILPALRGDFLKKPALDEDPGGS